MSYRLPNYYAGYASPQRGNMAYPQLWQGCIGAWNMGLGETGATLFDQSGKGNHGTLTGMDPATDWVVNGGNIALDFDAIDDQVILTPYQPTYPFTMCAWASSRTISATQCIFSFGSTTTTEKHIGIYLGGAVAGDPFQLICRNATTLSLSTTISYSANRWYHVCGVLRSSTDRTIYINGVNSGSDSASYTIPALDTLRIGGLLRLSFASALNGRADDCRLYDRALNGHEIATLALRRGIAYETYRVPIVRGAGGNVTVTPTTAALTLTTFAPTVSTPQTVTPSTATLTLTTFAPTVSTPVVVAPTTASLSLTTFEPTIVNPVTVTPNTASLTLSTFAPTVTADGSVTVTPTTASLSLTTFAPTVTTGGNVTATPSTASLSLTTFEPTVAAGGNVTVTPTTAALALSTFAPTVTAGGNMTVTPTTAALAITAYAPSIGTGAAISVDGNSLAITDLTTTWAF